MFIAYCELSDDFTIKAFELHTGIQHTILSNWDWQGTLIDPHNPLHSLISCHCGFIYTHPHAAEHAGFADSSGSTIMDFNTLHLSRCFWHPVLEPVAAVVSSDVIFADELKLTMYNLAAPSGRQVEGVWGKAGCSVQCAAWRSSTSELVMWVSGNEPDRGKLITMSRSGKVQQLDVIWPSSLLVCCVMAVSVHGMVAIAAGGILQAWNLDARQKMFTTCVSNPCLTWSPCGTFLAILEPDIMHSLGRCLLYTAALHAFLPVHPSLTANVRMIAWDTSGTRLLCQKWPGWRGCYVPDNVLVLDFAAA